MTTEFEEGVLVGLLIGEGHFGGDGRQPQITLRMHVRHEAMFNWLERTFPGGRLYGPYDHNGRHYYQWMARGAYLRDHLLPLVQRRLGPDLDAHAHARMSDMQARYARRLRGPAGPGAPDPAGTMGRRSHGRSVGPVPGDTSPASPPGRGSPPTTRRSAGQRRSSPPARGRRQPGKAASRDRLAQQIFETLRRGPDPGHDLDDSPFDPSHHRFRSEGGHGDPGDPSLPEVPAIRTTDASRARRHGEEGGRGNGTPGE